VFSDGISTHESHNTGHSILIAGNMPQMAALVGQSAESGLPLHVSTPSVVVGVVVDVVVVNADTQMPDPVNLHRPEVPPAQSLSGHSASPVLTAVVFVVFVVCVPESTPELVPVLMGYPVVVLQMKNSSPQLFVVLFL
jgi:hypothetical protein